MSVPDFPLRMRMMLNGRRVWCVLKYSGDADGYRVTALKSDFLQTVQRRMRSMKTIRQERVMMITEKKIILTRVVLMITHVFDNN